MAKNCGRCKAWRRIDPKVGECRVRALLSGETFRKVRSDDPGCREFSKGEWTRG